jgi:hypothetical protein
MTIGVTGTCLYFYIAEKLPEDISCFRGSSTLPETSGLLGPVNKSLSPRYRGLEYELRKNNDDDIFYHHQVLLKPLQAWPHSLKKGSEVGAV